MSPAPHLTVTLCSATDRLILCCLGEIDLATVHLLRQPLDEYLADPGGELTVDLRGVTYFDSTALKELLRGAVLLSRRGRQLRVRVTAHQQRLLILSHCDRVFTIEAP